jgi:hypothetical protein
LQSVSLFLRSVSKLGELLKDVLCSLARRVRLRLALLGLALLWLALLGLALLGLARLWLALLRLALRGLGTAILCEFPDLFVQLIQSLFELFGFLRKLLSLFILLILLLLFGGLSGSGSIVLRC